MDLSKGMRNRLSVALGNGGKMAPGREGAGVWVRCELGLKLAWPQAFPGQVLPCPASL